MLIYNGVWQQLFLFVIFFVVGIVSAFIYDAFRVSERFAQSGIILSFLKDILFWLIITFFMFLICLKFNNGEIRFFMFLSIFIGALAYFNTVSKYVLRILFFIIDLIKKVVLLLLKLILIPLKFVLRLINKPVFMALSFSKKGVINTGRKIKFKLMVLKKFKRR